MSQEQSQLDNEIWSVNGLYLPYAQYFAIIWTMYELF